MFPVAFVEWLTLYRNIGENPENMTEENDKSSYISKIYPSANMN